MTPLERAILDAAERWAETREEFWKPETFADRQTHSRVPRAQMIRAERELLAAVRARREGSDT